MKIKSPKPVVRNMAKEQPFINKVGKPLTGQSMFGVDKPAPKQQPFSKGLTENK